jgi:hypothetical protein
VQLTLHRKARDRPVRSSRRSGGGAPVRIPTRTRFPSPCLILDDAARAVAALTTTDCIQRRPALGISRHFTVLSRSSMGGRSPSAGRVIFWFHRLFRCFLRSCRQVEAATPDAGQWLTTTSLLLAPDMHSAPKRYRRMLSPPVSHVTLSLSGEGIPHLVLMVVTPSGPANPAANPARTRK